MGVLGDREGATSPPAVRATTTLTSVVEGDALLEHARHAAERAPAAHAPWTVVDRALALAVVAEPGGLEDRRIRDEVGRRRPRRRPRTGDRKARLDEELLLADAVWAIGDRLGGRRDRSRPGEALECRAGGFSNSVVTTAAAASAVEGRGRRRTAATTWTSATARPVPAGRGRAPPCRSPSRGPPCDVAAELAAAEHADRGRRAGSAATPSRQRPRPRPRPDAARSRYWRSAAARSASPAAPAAPRRTAPRWSPRPRRWRTSRPGRRPASARSRAASPGRRRWRTGTGTPSTGTVVLAASIPGRWAAPPAPAMIARSPGPPPPRRRRTSRRACGGRRRPAPRGARRTARAPRPPCSSSASRWPTHHDADQRLARARRSHLAPDLALRRSSRSPARS